MGPGNGVLAVMFDSRGHLAGPTPLTSDWVLLGLWSAQMLRLMAGVYVCGASPQQVLSSLVFLGPSDSWHTLGSLSS